MDGSGIAASCIVHAASAAAAWVVHVIICTKEDQGDVYYYLHKKLDDNYDVISDLERQLMIETADREKAEKEYSTQIEELEVRKDDELGPLKQKLRAEEEQVKVVVYT